MCNHICPYFDALFSKFQRGFRKAFFNTQHCLLVMIKKWCEVLDNGGEIETVLTGFFKAFDCINHNLLITKLNAYVLGDACLLLFILTLPKEHKRQK